MESRRDEIAMALLKRLVEKDSERRVILNRQIDGFECPACECTQLVRGNFCHICGQRLKWGFK